MNAKITCLLISWLFTATLHGAPSANYPPRVSDQNIRELLGTAPATHPRLLASAEDFLSLRAHLAREPRLRAISAVVIRDATQLLEAAPIERKLQGRRLLGESRRAVQRVLTLAMAFHLTQERVYADRAAREMLAAAAFSDWNPSHFLDTAEMTFALAIGYDWLHAQLDPAARAAIRQAIIQKGTRVPLDTRHHGWTQASNNWGQVCHGSMVAGALAVLEDDPETAVLTIRRALENVPRSMAAYTPKGSYPEGPGYWSYGTTYNVLLIALLESVIGTGFGLDQAPGFDRTGAYLSLTTGPSGLTFNYADGGAGRDVEPAVYWFAARHRRSEWLVGEERLLSRELEGDGPRGRFFPLLLLWSRDGGTPDLSRLPLHWNSEGSVPVALHRSSWTDPDAVFATIKAGSPSGPHGHMDVGSFVLDAGGLRWAADLGAESYHRIESRGMNFWSMTQESERWRVFRQGSLSHNTLVIDGKLQKASGHGTIVRFSDASDFPHSVVDMTGAYAGQAATVHRGLALLPNGGVLVRDRLTGLRPGAEVQWGMVTPASPVQAGGDVLQLRQGKDSLNLRILQPGAMKWTLLDTATPRNEWDSPNPGTVMCAFTALAPGDGTLDLAVILTPGTRRPDAVAPALLKPPLEWRVVR